MSKGTMVLRKRMHPSAKQTSASSKPSFGQTLQKAWQQARPKTVSEACPVICSWLIAIFGLSVVLYYIWGPGVGYMHADCTDTLYWAQASWDSGKWISDDFKYAALLPFGGNLLMLLYIPFFGVSVTTHNLGMTTFAILLGIAVYFAARSLGMQSKYRMLTVGAIYLAVSSSDKMREIFWGHVIYYSLGFLLLCICIILAMYLYHKLKEGELRLLPCLGAMVFFACVALNGGQMIVLVTLPLAAAFLMHVFLDVENTRKENGAAGFVVAIMAIATLMGLVFLKLLSGKVTAGYAATYSQWVPMEDWVDNLLHLPVDWFELFGIDVNKRMAMFSLESLPYMIRLAGALVVGIFPIGIMFQYPKLKSPKLRLYVLTHFVMSAAILFGFICGMLATANWRLSPIVISSVFLMFLYWSEVGEQKQFSFRLTGLAMAVVLLFSLQNGTTVLKMDWNYNRDKAIYQVADFLEEKGLTYGYATFWNSQLITVYSGDVVKTRNILMEEQGYHHEYYQSQYSWYEDQPGQETYFLLLSRYEYWDFLQTPMGETMPEEAIEIYEDVSGYYILVFDHNI